MLEVVRRRYPEISLSILNYSLKYAAYYHLYFCALVRYFAGGVPIYLVKSFV